MSGVCNYAILRNPGSVLHLRNIAKLRESLTLGKTSRFCNSPYVISQNTGIPRQCWISVILRNHTSHQLSVKTSGIVSLNNEMCIRFPVFYKSECMCSV